MDNEILHEKAMNAATSYLRLRGYEIERTGWKGRIDTVDIIARDPFDTLCFIEVLACMGHMPAFDNCDVAVSTWECIAGDYVEYIEDFDDGVTIRFDTIGIDVRGEHRALLKHEKGRFNG